jgi:aminoglycoside 3-N-acetyltransferase
MTVGGSVHPAAEMHRRSDERHSGLRRLLDYPHCLSWLPICRLRAVDMLELTSMQLVAAFRDLGIDTGDIVLVHSSYKSFGGVAGGPQTVIDALLEAIGPEGTLVVPTFNFDFCRGEPFDVRQTQSQMGVITELVRTNPNSKRVAHPIYSFAVLGARASECELIENVSSYGSDSLFAKLREWNGKIMVIGLAYNHSMTFFHHVEEVEGCDYRYMKEFTGEYTALDGSTSLRTYTMFVRDIDRGVVTAVDPMGELLERTGTITTRQIGEAKVRLMRAKDVYEQVAREMRRDPALLRQIPA